MDDFFNSKNNDTQVSGGAQDAASGDGFEKTTATDYVKCPSCGSTMQFNPQEQALSCNHCGRVEQFEKDQNVQELELTQAVLQTKSWADETTVYRCENCGAKVVLEKKEVSGNCPFCGTSHVVQTNEIAGIKPNALIPFIITSQTASENAKKWSKKRLFSPKKFKQKFKTDKLLGVYSPSFTFDSNAISVYKGRLGQRRTRTVGSGKNRRTETYIYWYSVKGTLENFFDDVTIAAGDKISQKELDKLSPFAKEKGCVYAKKFLHGFVASHYKKDINDSWAQARTAIDNQIRQAILRKHNADVVDYLDINTNHYNVTYKYVLMPVYVGNFTYSSKVYNVYINGSTGKVYGKAPISPLRVGLAAILALGAVMAAFLLYMHFGS